MDLTERGPDVENRLGTEEDTGYRLSSVLGRVKAGPGRGRLGAQQAWESALTMRFS